MLRRLFLAAGLSLAAAAACPQDLPPELEAALARSKLPREAVALYVAPAEGGSPRLAWRAEQAMNPASVAKLVTTVAGLDLLGPAFTWTTPVYADAKPRGGTLQGNLYIKGQGDPKLVAESLWLLVRRIQGLGIQRIQGDIVLDTGAFERAATDPGAFDGEPLRPYNAAPEALLVNYKSVVLTFTPDGASATLHAEPALAGVQWPASVPTSQAACGDWRAALQADFSDPARPRLQGAFPAACGERVWPLAFADPASYAARAIAGMWRQAGGTLAGSVREGRVPAGLPPLLEWRSPTLAEVVRDINKFSNNVMAEQLFLTLPLQKQGAGTPQAARDVVRQWWRDRIGGEPPLLDNGSGLSRTGRVSARQLGALLHFAWNAPFMPELAASLPLAGADGTLRRATAAAAHLKTGSLKDVTALAGYVDGASGRRWVLVAIANDPASAAARPVFEALVDWTARQR